MVTENKLARWDPLIHEAKERCEATVTTSQCPRLKAGGTNYCTAHGANKAIEKQQAETQRNYRLGRWQKRVGEFADNGGVKDLREEIGILRMILEEMYMQCSDSMDLLLYSQRMSDLVMKIEKLVSSCDRLENRMGMLLSKDSVLQLAACYVKIINTYVIDPEIIENISREIVEVTEKLESPLEV
jgi:hypothetical protein